MSGIEPNQRSYIRQVVENQLAYTAPRLGVVEDTYPHAESGDDSNYEVDVRVVSSGVPGTAPSPGDGEGEGDGEDGSGGSSTPSGQQTHQRVPVSVATAGATRGLSQGDFVLVEYLQANSESPIVTQALYDVDNRAPLTQPGDYRRKIGEDAVIEIITDDQDNRKLNLGREGDTDRGGIDMGLTMNLDGGGFCLFDGSSNGLFFDGSGNGLLKWESFAMPIAAAGDVNFENSGSGSSGSGNSGNAGSGGTNGARVQSVMAAASASGMPQAEALAESAQTSGSIGGTGRGIAPNSPRIPDTWVQAGHSPHPVAQPDVDETVDLASEGLQDGELIDPYLEEHFSSGTWVDIPAGRYRWHGGGIAGNYRDAALIGRGGPVELYQADGATQTATLTVPGGGDGSVRLANIAIRGEHGSYDRPTASLRIGVTDGTSSALLDSVYLPDGGDRTGGAAGIGVSARHAGDLIVRNSFAQGFPEGGLHASAPGMPDGDGGRVIIEGGLYRANGTANVRVGSTASIVRAVTAVGTPGTPAADSGGGSATYSILATETGTEVRIEDCDITHEAGVSGSPVAMQSPRSDATTSGTITNTRIANATGQPAITVETGHTWDGRVHFTGDGSLAADGGSFDTVTGVDADGASMTPRRIG